LEGGLKRLEKTEILKLGKFQNLQVSNFLQPFLQPLKSLIINKINIKIGGMMYKAPPRVKRAKNTWGYRAREKTSYLQLFQSLRNEINKTAEGRQVKNYANAKNVLPEELLREVKKHHTGFLWIPKDESREKKKKLVIALRKEGMTSNEISRVAGLSARRVSQIIKESEEL
jgi:hypothetical protein